MDFEMTLFYAGAFRDDRGAPFYIPEGRTYSPPARRAGGGIPPAGRARALFPKCPPDTSPEGAANAIVFQTVVIACADGRASCRRLLRFRRKTVVPSTGTTCHLPA